ncbi:hypothetical protein SCLCIDRAFT_1216280 [Scleroderma citrinum Foug A]|uniref:Uncharacterized protein n=1 Tax=Scleroderma citrinum Foug A TaxID=1036808 RepID=A0A0C3DXT6_9AGAM|nr:hypothetical protein SCLCIDRAFT_1216280 [Scleroderma citrinum Foug A]
MARHSSVLLPTIKMVRFFGVASLLLFSYTALVAADTMPRVPIAETNNVGAMLQGRDTCTKCPDGKTCCSPGTFCCNSVARQDNKCCTNGWSCGSKLNQIWCYPFPPLEA